MYSHTCVYSSSRGINIGAPEMFSEHFFSQDDINSSGFLSFWQQGQLDSPAGDLRTMQQNVFLASQNKKKKHKHSFYNERFTECRVHTVCVLTTQESLFSSDATRRTVYFIAKALYVPTISRDCFSKWKRRIRRQNILHFSSAPSWLRFVLLPEERLVFTLNTVRLRTTRPFRWINWKLKCCALLMIFCSFHETTVYENKLLLWISILR